MAEALRRRMLVAALVVLVAGVLAAVTHDPSGGERVAVGTGDAPPSQSSPARPVSLEAGDAEPTTTTSPSTTSTTATAPAPISTRSRTVGEGPAAPTTSTTVADPARDDPNGPDVVRGRVTDEAGRPVAGVCFQSTLPESTRPQILATSGADGRYRIEGGFFAVMPFVCQPELHEFGYEVVDPRSVMRNQLPTGTVTQDIHLQQLGGVHGRVVDQDGNPVAGVVMSVEASDWPPHEPTGADGRFTLANVTRGTKYPWAHHMTSPQPLTPQRTASFVVRPGVWNEVTFVLAPWVPWNGTQSPPA